MDIQAVQAFLAFQDPPVNRMKRMKRIKDHCRATKTSFWASKRDVARSVAGTSSNVGREQEPRESRRERRSSSAALTMSTTTSAPVRG
jgi:hypothetical protein